MSQLDYTYNLNMPMFYLKKREECIRHNLMYKKDNVQIHRKIYCQMLQDQHSNHIEDLYEMICKSRDIKNKQNMMISRENKVENQEINKNRINSNNFHRNYNNITLKRVSTHVFKVQQTVCI